MRGGRQGSCWDTVGSEVRVPSPPPPRGAPGACGPRRSLRPLPLTVACEAPPDGARHLSARPFLLCPARPRVAQPRWPLRCPRTRRALAHLGTLPPAAPSAGNVLPSHLFPLLLKRHLILTTTFEAQRALFLRPLAPLPCSAFSSLKQFPLSATPLALTVRLRLLEQKLCEDGPRRRLPTPGRWPVEWPSGSPGRGRERHPARPPFLCQAVSGPCPSGAHLAISSGPRLASYPGRFIGSPWRAWWHLQEQRCGQLGGDTLLFRSVFSGA